MNPSTDPTTDPLPIKHAPSVKVLGVGGAGLHAVERMAASDLPDLAFAAIHTDARRLKQSPLPEKLLLGSRLTRGLGAGGDPDLGRAAGEEETQRIRALCAGSDLIIVVAGLGGGTGSGAAPVVARTAHESGALVLSLVALPFEFEGSRRLQQAQAGLKLLKTASDAVLCLPNQKVSGMIDANTPLIEAFGIADEMLVQGVRGLWRLVTREGLIDVDFAHLCHVVRGRHAESCFATAEASGEGRAREVMTQLLAHPMLDEGRLLGEADAVLVSVVGGKDLTLKEVNQVMEQLHRACESAQVIMGAATDDGFQGRLSMTLVVSKRNAAAPTGASVAPTRSEPEPPTAEFPTSIDDVEAASEGRAGGQRPAFRFVPPAPALSAEKAEELLSRQSGASPRSRKKAARMRQGMLPLEVVSKGRFANSEPTIHNGEDLDTPSYIRRGIALN